ncbi:MAG: hypothetical protein ACE37H_00735 [Phycisphaeraceae bacterium]
MPFIQEPLPVVSQPPMREWSFLGMPWDSSVTEVSHFNMPNLYEMYCDYNPIQSLPWDELPNLSYLSIYGCSFITLDLWQAPNLSYVYASYNQSLITIDAHDQTVLNSLDLYDCTAIESMDFSGCTNLNYLYAYGCNFSVAAVDQLLEDLVNNGATNGYLQMNGGGSASPSNPDGLALKAILVNRGWNVYHN